MKQSYTRDIDAAIESLHTKMINIDVGKSPISDYNKGYFREYQEHFYFFMPLYKQLLQKVLSKLSKPISESVFLDYGGGCGILSYLAVELGFKSVLYNDIYEVSVNDVQIIAKELKCPIASFILGGIKDVVTTVNAEDIQLDVIASFDVLEHIYDLDQWFDAINSLSKPFFLCFMTSANTANPIIKRRLKKIHNIAEYKGSVKTIDHKERDSVLPFLEIRTHMIAKEFPNIRNDELALLAKNTRGLYGKSILQSAAKQLQTQQFQQEILHATNTCDPLTGNWAEHSIDLSILKNKIQNRNTFIEFTNGYYSYSTDKMLNIPKYLLNVLMKLFGKQSLFLSPNYTLEVVYKK